MLRILPLNTLFTRAFILITALALSACAIFGNPNPPDETKGWAEQRLYAAGMPVGTG